ncbi:PAS domain S-box-containing protein [Blastococcus sp. DSM 46786]|uniref:sensor histidine kinase n=1 Tax=Blastococcus sp. DSM 46786 TaxID=1798227 RepID=UPI0008CD08AD|nr:ATP-binding protein [Blastococcus sp. DSM 46786]SEK84087.1 PAS domain S-box-containing protein [Blastococcus sp. DSM 46786]
MSLAVLDRRQDAGDPWIRRLTEPAGRPAAVHGPLLCTVLHTAAALLLLTGALPVVDRGLVLAGLAAASAATGVAWTARRSRSVVGSLAVPAAHLGAVALLHAGTGSATTLFLLVGPLWALATLPDRRGVLVAVLGTTAVLAAPALAGPPTADDLPGALLLGPLAVAVGTAAVHGSSRRLAAQSHRIAQLQREQAALLAQVQSRADELDTASRILAARAQTMTSVIDAVTEQSIIGTDRDGTIRVWNPGAEKMLGVPRPDVVRTRSILDFHLPEELAAAAEDRGCGTGLEALVHAARQHGSDVRDWTYVAADGSHRTVSVAITPRSDDRGVHAGWNFVGTDMTEARATERLKDQFVSLISHELRTPLSSILGYLELVMDDEDQPLTDEQRQYLSTVERNAQRLLRLVGDLLFTAQVESGRFTLQPADVDLAGVVRAAEETARVAAASAGVQIVVDVPEDGLVVAGDAVRLGQACDNLVSNAVKFTPAGGRIDLALRRGWRTPDGAVVDHRSQDAVPVALLSVADTGMGIPAGEQGQMFTRFFRTSNAQRNAVPGVGLGLTITKAITTAHGGTLDLVSAEGVGTTFTMALPVAG